MMSRTKKQPRSRNKNPEPRNTPFHAFWSGSLSFGLVNVPVLVFPATRHSEVRLRLISPQGSLLERRFFCPRDGKVVSDDEIVRGFELDDGSYIVVEDDELEAMEPRKSREMDLREFVDLSELTPALLERAYYLTPDKEATKAYRLLAEVMEKTRRAGIATVVMRDREYLVAIFARDGILCAETMRFHDEIRDPQTLGLPAPAPQDRERVSAFERSIGALFTRSLPQEELADKTTETLRALIEKKRKAGRDLIRTGGEKEDTEPAEAEGEIDLLETIRQSLRQSRTPARKHSQPARPRTGEPRGQGKKEWPTRGPGQQRSHAKKKV